MLSSHALTGRSRTQFIYFVRNLWVEHKEANESSDCMLLLLNHDAVQPETRFSICSFFFQQKSVITYSFGHLAK
jgi:hypothetical protein